MMKKISAFLLITLTAMMCIPLAACDFPGSLPNINPPGSNAEMIPEDITALDSDRPTIPDDAAIGTKHLYDFRFSERYDDRVTADFSLTFPAETLIESETGALSLLSRYRPIGIPTQENSCDSDGTAPYKYKDRAFFEKSGNLFVKTHLYEQDDVEYIAYLWTDRNGVKTNRDVGVGDSEKALFAAYTDNLYYLNATQTEPVYFSLEPHPACDFDYAYAWQPFTPETNEIRDITFYIKNDKIAAVEMTQPLELRYVYGYDREFGLQQADNNRSK